MKEQQTMRVTFMDGKTMKFALPRIQGSQAYLSSLVKRARSVANLLLEADGKLLVIPMANVRVVEFSPAPEGGPIAGLITGAKSIK